MTGFGRAESGEGVHPRLTVDARSVNARYAKVAVSLPRRYAPLEPRVRQEVQKYVSRGVVEVSVSVEGGPAGERYELDEAAVRGLLAAWCRALSGTVLEGKISAEALAIMPGVYREISSERDLEPAWSDLAGPLAEALQRLVEARRREGQALWADVRRRLERLTELKAEIAARAPQIVPAHLERLRARLNELLAQSEAERQISAESLERELVLYADRTDISEELARLESHCAQFERLLQEGGQVGKMLDFLGQELFREANTLGSKAGDAQISRQVVEMKAEIEKIREQVQNLE